MTRRIWINLGVFAALFLVLAWWDVNNVLRLDAIKRPYHVSADFATSPGLRTGFGVSYLGVSIGHLGSVKVVGTHVRVDMKINRGVQLPAELDAKVRRKSAVGEPYVDLTPTGGVDRGGPRLKAGTHIPLARTSTPLEYSEVFDTIGRLVDALPIGDVNRILHSVAQGIDGRTDDFRAIISSASQLTGTLAANAPLLDQLSDDLTALTHTLATHRQALGTGFDSLATLAQVIASQKDHLASLLDKAPGFVGDVKGLLDNSGSNIGCLFEEASNIWTSLDTPLLVSSFSKLVALAPATGDLLRAIAYQGPDGPYINGTLVIQLTGDSPRTYNPPLTMPPVPAIQTCSSATHAGAAGSQQGTASGGTTPAGPGAHAVPTPGIPTPTVPGHEASSERKTKGIDLSRYILPAVVLALLLLLGALVSLRPWQRIAALRRRGGDGDAG
jgi:phospholipid/cholesterol/gamma-HCH transport system substrate-binding protein